MRDLHPGGRGERRARDQRAQLDELVRRDRDRPQVARCRRRSARRRARRPGSPTRAATFPGACSVASSCGEPDLPLVAPDVEVHVDDVVVGDREPAQRVADLERPSPRRARCSARRSASFPPRCATPKVPGGSTAAEVGAAAGPVAAARSRAPRRREIDSPGSERDLAVAAGEGAVEGVLDVLVDERARRSARTWTETSAWTSVYDFAAAAPGERERRRERGEEDEAATRSERHSALRGGGAARS